MVEYKKDLGVKESTAIVISRIIGSGIFRTPAPIMALVGCTSLFGLVWIIGGIITVFGAVIYAELTAMLPKSGGPYVFLRKPMARMSHLSVVGPCFLYLKQHQL